MCDKLSRAIEEHQPTLGRRSLLGAATVAGLAPALLGVEAHAAPSRTAFARPRTRTGVTLLGTAGGPVFMTADRRGISTAVTYGDRVYVVDLGHGSVERLVETGMVGETLQSALMNVRAILFTHLHSDHITEWPAVYMTGPSNTENGGRSADPIKVRGPGNRGTLPPVFPPTRPSPPVVSPEDPTPGIQGMTAYLRRAFASDFNDRIRDSRWVDHDSVFDIEDIDIAPYWSVDERGVPPILPPGTKIPVLVDDPVSITATLVDHHPTAPAFGYRFDTPDGSVVISGDTAPSENLIDLAKGCDYLVHEVIDEIWVDEFTSTLPPEVGGALKQHLLESHTTIAQIGTVATRAEAKNLVLTHLAPAEILPERFRKIRRHYEGRLHVGKDLMSLGV